MRLLTATVVSTLSSLESKDIQSYDFLSHMEAYTKTQMSWINAHVWKCSPNFRDFSHQVLQCKYVSTKTTNQIPFEDNFLPVLTVEAIFTRNSFSQSYYIGLAHGVLKKAEFLTKTTIYRFSKDQLENSVLSVPNLQKIMETDHQNGHQNGQDQDQGGQNAHHRVWPNSPFCL